MSCVAEAQDLLFLLQQKQHLTMATHFLPLLNLVSGEGDTLACYLDII